MQISVVGSEADRSSDATSSVAAGSSVWSLINAETGHVDLRKSSCPVTRLIKLNRAQRRSEPPLPTNYSNFVHEQNGHRRHGSTNGQRVTSEEVQGHAYPAKANSYQGTTNIRRSDCCREARAKDVPEPKILS
jgi:hypothetical protein